jgi:putative ABC transport system permease protein
MMQRGLRHALRMLIRNPGLTVVAVLALTLGIGLSTTMFSIVYGILLRGLPFEDSHQLVFLSRNSVTAGSVRLAIPLRDLWAWQEWQSTFTAIAGWARGSFSLGGDEAAPERLSGAYVTPNVFSLLQTQPILGRGFTEGDDLPGTNPVVIIGYSVWQSRLAGDSDVLGRTIRVNGEAMTVVGVMPQGFEFPTIDHLWIPLRYDPVQVARGGGPTVNGLGRLRDGVSRAAALGDLAVIARQLEREYPETHQGIGVNVEPYIETLVGRELTALAFTMLAPVFGVMLIACSNVANLLLARAVVRTKELAIRSALGSSRMRAVALLLTEAGTLAVLGGVLGVGFAWIGIRLFNNSMVNNWGPPPFWVDISLNGAVMLLVLGLIMTAAVAAGTVPAVQASRVNLNAVLQDESRGTSSLRIGRFSRALVSLEIALSCGLLVPAALATRSAMRVGQMDFDFATHDVFMATIPTNQYEYPDDAARLRFYEDLLARLEAEPGVISCALSSAVPGLGSGATAIGVEGVTYQSDRDFPVVRWAAVTPGFFETLGVELRQGRGFESWDNRDGDPVTIVNQSFVERFLAGRDPLGRRIRFGRSASDTVWRTIVGVVPDMMMNRRTRGGMMDEAPEGVYLPLAQMPRHSPNLLIRAAGPPLGLAGTVRTVLAAIDPDRPLANVNTLAAAIDDANWMYRALGTLFGIFGLAALFLASVGLYGVMAFSVGRRTGEFGVRMALGARAGDVLRLVLSEGARQLIVGLVIGLGIAVVLARLLRTALFQVEPNDPVTFVIVVTALVAAGISACLIPARRATRVDPIEALRVE